MLNRTGILLGLLLLTCCTVRAQGLAMGAPSGSAPRLGVVLSGGGVRGLAHIGALRALERSGIPIYCLVGSSTGAVVGGLYACGYSPDEIDSLLGRYSWGDLFQDRPDRRLMSIGRKDVSDRHLVEIRLQGWKPQWVRSLSSGQRVSQALAEMVWRAPIQGFGNFDRLRVRYRAVATDLSSGLRAELGGGDLAEAMRASMSVPFLFQPVKLDGRLLIDGGIADNIPVETARKLGADLVLVVDVTSPLRDEKQLAEAWELADQIVGIMQVDNNQRSLAAADLVVRPHLPRTPMNVLGSREQFQQAGEEALLAELEHLRRLLHPACPGPREAAADGWVADLLTELWNGSAWVAAGSLEHLLSPGPELPGLMETGPRTRRQALELRRELAACGSYCEVDLQLADSLSDPCVHRLRLTPNPVLQSVAVTGLDPIRERLRSEQWAELGVDSLLSCLGVGQPLQRAVLDQQVDQLLIRLRRAGFALCELDSMDWADGRLRLFFQPGQVDTLRVDGLVKLRPGVLLREFRPRAGEVFSVRQADRSIGRLFASGLYEQVYLRLERDRGRNVAILHASERAFPALRAGLHYGSARQGEGFFQILWENLLRRSLRGEAAWLLGAWRREQRASLESDRIWKTWLTTRLNIWQCQEELHFPHASGTGMTERSTRAIQLRLGQQIQGLGSVFLSGGLEWEEEEQDGLEHSRQLARLGLLSRVDSRNRRVLPRNGEYHEASFEQLVPRGQGGDAAFRARVAVDSWRSLGNHTGQLSLLAGTTDSPERRDRFELGGDDWLRSLPPAELAARRLLGVRAGWRMVLGQSWPGEWSASLRWSALGLTDDLDDWPRRRGFVQEAGLALHLGSWLGELAAGVALLTDAGPADSPGPRLWVELGHPF
ncbi:MAG: patatin-like phospholipase family protein [Candidatus Delongbacteria bacterium]